MPWTWGPISIPTGQGIVAIGVYEIVYWVGGKPEYRWQYVNAGTTGAAAAGGGIRTARIRDVASLTVVRAASRVLRGAYCRIEGKVVAVAGATAAPLARVRRAARSNVGFPRQDGETTFDARVSKSVLKHARSHPQHTRPRTTTRTPAPRLLSPR